ncbi:MAG: hypothetical protein ACI9W4_001709 [Rhodothermales bacterium]|jgi:hypothetical protein
MDYSRLLKQSESNSRDLTAQSPGSTSHGNGRSFRGILRCQSESPRPALGYSEKLGVVTANKIS